MKLLRVLGLMAVALFAVPLAGCTTTGIVSTFQQATGASISSSRAITYDDAIRTIQDAVTGYTNGCVATQSTTGLCAYGDQAYADSFVLRADRNAPLQYAQTHDRVPIGVGGVLALTETAVANIQAILKNAGIVTPIINP